MMKFSSILERLQITNRRGFTMIEIMVALVIMSFISMAGYALLESSKSVMDRQVTNTDGRNDLRLAILQITKDIQQSNEVPVNEWTLNSYKFIVLTDTSDREDDNSQALEEEVIYSLNHDEGKLYRMANGEMAVLAEKVDNFFINPDEKAKNFTVLIIVGNETKEIVVSRRLVEAEYSSVNGEVKDSSTGLAIPGANIVIENIENGMTYTARTDDNGNYMVDLPAGNYKIFATKIGYVRKDHESSINLTTNMSAIIDFVLDPEEGDFADLEKIMLFTNNLLFKGKEVKGHSATAVFNDAQMNRDGWWQADRAIKLDVSNIYFASDINMVKANHQLGSREIPGMICIKGDLHLKGRGIGLGAIAPINIYGDLYVDGNAKLEDNIVVHGDIHVTGNLTIDRGGDYRGNIYVGGNMTFIPRGVPTSIGRDVYVNGRLTVDSILITPVYINKNATIYYREGSVNKSRYSKTNNITQPSECKKYEFEIPFLREDSWYSSKGYSSSIASGKTSGIRVYMPNNITVSGGSSSSRLVTYTNSIIVSKGNITINANTDFSGVLFAPNGKVIFKGRRFDGVIIARDGIETTASDGKILFNSITEYISDSNDYPFTYVKRIQQ